MLERLLEKIIIEKELFTDKDYLLVGVSGGIDSVVLCHVLKKLKFKFSIAHCNFQLREKESELDEIFCEEFAKKLDVNFHVMRFETKGFAKSQNISIQMAARELRYNWFQKICDGQSYQFVLTAHHLNDQLETFLLNFTRGTGLSGLLGIPGKQGNVIRPLLEIGREEIENYAKENGLAYREDSSNYEEKYARNLIRKHVISALKKINPSLEKTALRNLGYLKNSHDLTQYYLNQRMKELNFDANRSLNKIMISELKREKHLSFVLHGMLSQLMFNSTQIENAESLLFSETGKQVFSEQYILLRNRDEIVIKKNEPNNFSEIIIPSVPFVAENISISFGLVEKVDSEVENKERVAYFDLDKVQFPLKIRTWKKGDRFYPEGMIGSKKLSDYFVGIKASKFEKDSALILVSGADIMWIIGKRKDRRLLSGSETKNILKVEVFS
jgi:tRNA(Ile)-lysidine synthase